MKPQRVVDEQVLEDARNLPCLACVRSQDEFHAALENPGPVRSHPHHLKSVKSGGPDSVLNVVSLCFFHHREIHAKGISYMNTKYPLLAAWLSTAGWQLDPLIGWHNENL